MKLRIHGNSLRLRLTRPEVAEFAGSGCVKSVVRFGGGAVLHYSLSRTSAAELTAQFTGDHVAIEVPEAAGRKWTDSDEVSLTGLATVDDGMNLEIIVEKDFQCLHKGEDSKDPDAYPHPLA